MKITELMGMIKLLGISNVQYFSGVTQRYYEWNKLNIQDYLEGIRYIDIDKNRPYLIDSIVTKRLNGNLRFEEISLTDGQQRMTTTYLHISAICSYVKNNNLSDGKFDWESIRDDYLINPRQKGDKKYKLLLREEDRDTLKMIVDELPLPLPTNAGRPKLINAYNQLYESLTEDNYLETFEKLFHVVTANVIAEENDDEYVIFNMINGSGKKASLFTQCKAYAIGKYDLKTQELFDKLYWNPIESNERYKDTIIRSYVLYHNHVDSNTTVYYQFKELFNGFDSIDEFHEDLTKYTSSFLKIKNNEFEDKYLSEVMDGLRLIVTPARYPVLIRIYHNYLDGNITKTEMLDSLNLLLNVGMRRYIFNHKAWLNESRNMFETNVTWLDFNNLYYSIFDKTKNMRTSDSQFKNTILTSNFYKDTSSSDFKSENEKMPSNINSVVLYLLLRIENAHYGAGRISKSHYSVEHICPKKLNKNWRGSFTDEEHHDYVHNLGNLTLLAKEHNSTVGRKSFEEKREIFANDKLYLGKAVCSYDEWNIKSIHSRTISLAEELCDIFEMSKNKSVANNQSVLIGGK